MSFYNNQPPCGCQQTPPIWSRCDCENSQSQSAALCPDYPAPSSSKSVSTCEPVTMQQLCVRPACGVIAMPERDYEAMPVQGAQVPNNAYYRRLIQQGKVTQVDCQTGCESESDQWTGQKACSFSHLFKDQQVLSIYSLLAQSSSGSPSVYSIHIEVRESSQTAGIMLARGNTQDLLQVDDEREWQGHDDGIGNLSPATDFYLYLNDGDQVSISWDELA